MTILEQSTPTYVEILDVVSGGTSYFGVAVSGTATSAAGWQIQRSTVSGTVSTFTYADGDANHDNIWDNRASLSYS